MSPPPRYVTGVPTRTQQIIWNRDAFEGLLRKHCLINGWTNKDFAQQVGISAGALADIVNLTSSGTCRRNPSPALIKKLADELGVAPGALSYEAAPAS